MRAVTGARYLRFKQANGRSIMKKPPRVAVALWLLSIIIPLLSPASGLAQNAPIKIGVVLPMSGGLEIYGKQGLQGAAMAVAEINAAGGVLDGRKLEMIVEDNRSDTRRSVEKFQKLALQDKVHAVLGPVTSANRDAMTPHAADLKTPLLYGINYEGGACDRYLFCYGMVPDHQITPFIPYLMEHYGTSFYLFGADYVWPRKTNALIREMVAENGGTVAGEAYARFGKRDFSAVIHDIRQSGAKVLITTLPGLDGQIFLTQCADAGLKKTVKIAPMDFNDNYMESLSGKDAEGLICCNHFIESLQRPDAKDFVARQKSMFGEDAIVSFYADTHYGLVKMFARAIEKAGTDDKEAVIDAMPGVSAVSGNGTVVMRDDHHVTLNMLVSEVVDGKLTLKEDIGPIDPPKQCRFETPSP